MAKISSKQNDNQNSCSWSNGSKLLVMMMTPTMAGDKDTGGSFFPTRDEQIDIKASRIELMHNHMVDIG